MLLLAFSGAAPPSAEPDPIHLRFEVFGGPGLHFLTLSVRVDQSPDRYAIAVEAETRSLADLFLDLRSGIEVHGRIAADELVPQAMRSETHRRGVDFYTRIDYRTDGTLAAQATPPPSWPVTPVTAEEMRGTVDQLTAYLALARTLARHNSCALALAVFDGRRRYDLVFGDLASETLPGFAGPTRVCRMARHRIAGFRAEPGSTQQVDQGKLWFARLVPGNLLIPLRIEFDSEFGTFTANLAELQSRGVDMRFTE
jgi:Protein of unknown function (DUF3108)